MKKIRLLPQKCTSTLGVFLLVTFLSLQQSSARSMYIDPKVNGLPAINSSNPEVLQLISHGRPGALFLDGKWRDANEIVHFIREKHLTDSKVRFLNIYGCEFAKGIQGLKAVSIIEKELGLAVAASNNITGKHGDWILEVGKSRNVLNVPDYAYDLQTICQNTTYAFINGGWSAAPAAPGYAAPVGCTNNFGTTTNAEIDIDRGFNTQYDCPSGYYWSRTLSGLNPAKHYRVYVNMYSISNAPDKRDAYFQNFNLAGQTGTFACHGNTSGIPDQQILDFVVTNQSSLFFGGTIIASNWFECQQAVDYRVQINVQEVITTNAYTAPSVTATTASNICPASITNLTNIASGCGNGLALEWHSTNTGYSNATKLSNITAINNGTYYAICHDTVNSCYSSPSAAVVVSNHTCATYNPDMNATFVNIPVSGDMANNDILQPGYTFGTPVASTGNPSSALPLMNPDGIDTKIKGQTSGKVFYRVKQVDNNQKYTWSNVVDLTNDRTKGAAYIFPNPVAGNLFSFVYQHFDIESTDLDIRITDASGRMVLQANKAIVKGKNQLQIATNNLAAGNYFLNYSDDTHKIKGSIKFVKQ
jgi:hypothetical protein